MKKIKQNITILLIILLLIPLNANASNTSSICGDNSDCNKYASEYLGSISSAIAEQIKYIPNISVCSGGATLCFQGDVESNGLGGRGLYLKIIKYNDDETETIVGTPILLWNGSFLNSVSSVVDNGANAEVNGYSMYDSNDCTYRYFITFDGASIVEFNKNNIKYYIDGSNVTYDVNTIYDKNLPSTNDGVVDYVKQTLIEKYFSTPEKVKTNFSLSNQEYKNFLAEMDKYYIAFEPAQRSTNVTSVDGMTEVRTSEIKHSESKGTSSKSTAWFCKSPRKYKYQSTKPSASDCNDGTYICSSTKTEFTTEEECNNSCNSSCGLKNLWSSFTYCSSTKYEYYQTMKIHYYSADSYVRPARYTSSLKLIASMVTPKDDTDCNNSTENGYSNCVKRPVWKEDPETGQNIHATDSNGNKMYEYYIGPTLKTALVGAGGNNKYKLWDSSIMLTQSNLSSYKSQNYAIGVSYWWFPKIISCENTCGDITDKGSDALLACAEQFCDNAIGYDDRANTQSQKACCITSQCGYQYTPVSCSNSNPYKNIDTSTEISSETTCSVLNVDGTKSKDNIRTIVACYGDVEPTKNADGSLDFSNINYDEKTYINVACKESSSFEYADLSTKRIIAGEGINYFANLYGSKECTIYFDLPSWKFAYASYHSQDEVYTKDSDGDGIKDSDPKNVREQLVAILNYYNKCAIGDKSDPICSSGSTIGIDIEGNSIAIDWEEFGYDIDKVKVNTKVTEIVNNEPVSSDSYTLVISGNKTDTSKIINGIDKINEIKYNGKTLLSAYNVNRYLTNNRVNASYTFDKYCVTTDGKATIYKTPANGICESAEEGISATEILGKNVYYTSLNATPSSEITSGDTHAIKNTTVTIENENTGTNYLEDTEYCPYKIESGGLSCSILITPNTGTNNHGNNIYDGAITAELIIHDQLGITDSIEEVGLSIDNSQELNGTREISVNMSNTSNGAEIKNIYGTVKTKNGEQVTCDTEIKIVYPCEKAGISCQVNKIDNSNNLYEISTNASKAYYALSSNILNLKDVINHPEKYGFKEVYKTLHNGVQKYLIEVANRNELSVLYGLVEKNGRYCACWDELPDIEVTPNCTEDCNRSDISEVKAHCEENWSTDVNNYKSYEDCVTRCRPNFNCDSYKDDNACSVSKIENDCTTNYRTWGFTDISTCINYAYNDCNCAGIDYIYRPVNNSNPFPNSYESYIPGDRIIGGNWVGKTEYITDDHDDSTSVTGAQAGNAVEYVIDLTPSDIEAIRKDTEAYNSLSGKDAYLDYVSVEQGKEGYCLEEGYCSQFINGSEFTNTIFTVK